MLSRRHRFHGRNTVRAAYARGKLARGAYISLHYGVRTGPYRAAVVVSRKVSKSAVIRSRIRRRLYEQVRLAAPQFANGYDLVLTAFDEQLATMPGPELASIVQNLLQKAGLLINSGEQSPARAIVKDKED